MSIIANSSLISESLEEKIINDVIVKKAVKSFGPQGMRIKYEDVRPYRIVDDKIYLPFRWALQNIPGLSRKTRSECQSIKGDLEYTVKLNNIQEEINDQCVKALNKYGCILISLFCGCGKTFYSIYLAHKIRLKTLIIIHRVILQEQWQESIKECLKGDYTISVLKPKGKPSQFDADFLIVNAINMKKFKDEDFKDVSCVIVDEIHSILAEQLSECLRFVSPRYLIGLSATPYRPDGLDGLLDFYFGKDNKVVRELYHPHVVYKIKTTVTYMEENNQWNALITSQSMNEDRNNFIVELIKKFNDRCILVLCKRIEQAKYIFEKLKTIGEKASIMVENKNTFDKDSRVIVAGVLKCGVGFSFSKLNTLILASDVISSETEEYMIQILARVIRTREVKPIVFDIVDNHGVLQKHFLVRKRVYEKAGGVIKNFNKEFPEMKIL
jgi:superfamily II DNA or RNA helicase